jgi:hypothetical protein
MAISSQDYSQLGGDICPNCENKGTVISNGEITLDDDPVSATAEQVCNNCQARWRDEFILTGYSALWIPVEQED